MTSPRDEAPENAAPDDEGQVSELSDLSEAQEGGADAVEKTSGVPPRHDQ